MLRRIADATICRGVAEAQALYGFPPDTTYLAEKLGYQKATMYLRLRQLAAQGLVQRGPRRAGGYTWRLLGEI